jgi:AraC-like DNA-binding protein
MYELCRASGRDAIVDAISRAYCDAHIETHAGIQGHVHQAPLGDVAFNFVRLTVPLEADSGANDAFFCEQFTSAGGARFCLDGREFACGGTSGVLLSPENRMQIRLDGETSLWGVKLARERLEEQLSLMLGGSLDVPLEFEPAVDLRREAERRRHSLIRFIIGELDRQSPLLRSRLALANLEEELLQHYLELAPHNYSERLAALRTPTSLRHVREVEAFIEAHPERAIDVRALGALTGASASSIYQAFKQQRGHTPIAFLREMRLRRVREELLHPPATTTVTEIAIRWGFAHLGRFSGLYRRRFGEQPSATLAHSQRRA